MATEISSVPHGRRDVACSLPTPRSSPSTIMSSSILGYGSTVYPLNTQMSPRIVRLPDGNDTWPYEGALSGNLNPPTGSPAQPSSTPRPPATDQHPPHPPLPHSPPSKIKLLRDVCIRFPSLLSRNNFRPRHTIADCNRYKTDSYILWRSRGLSGQSERYDEAPTRHLAGTAGLPVPDCRPTAGGPLRRDPGGGGAEDQVGGVAAATSRHLRYLQRGAAARGAAVGGAGAGGIRCGTQL